MKVRIGAKKIVCSNEAREEDVLAVTDEARLTGGRGRSGERKRDGRGGRAETAVEGGL